MTARCETHELEGCADCSGEARQFDRSLEEPRKPRRPRAGEQMQNGKGARGNARDVPCPHCAAMAGWPCREYKWRPGMVGNPPLIPTYHRERWAEWRSRPEED